MCGLAGIYHLDGEAVEPQLLREMTDTVAHRGPDGAGYETLNNLGLGHRRLAVIDLAGGAQPMFSDDRHQALIFNGEIYNYIELREELLKSGERFRTSSDTEVILKAFKVWGTAAFSRFNGQFALALFDQNSRSLYLARDLMGEKPLYFGRFKESVVFASEIKAILPFMKARNISREINKEAFWDFLSLNYVPFEQSFLRGIFSVAPGSYLCVSPSGMHQQAFEFQRSIEPPSTDITTLLDRAFLRRSRSDVPVGIFLSGGVDSSVIASTLHRAGRNLKAYIADIKERSHSEARNALNLCKMLGLSHQVFEIDLEKENLPALIEALVWHADEPLADSSALPVYLLSRGTAKEVKVVLSGDGGDELFGGYLTYKASLLATLMGPALRRILSLAEPLVNLLPHSNNKVGWHEKLERFLRNLSRHPRYAHFAWNGMFSSAAKLRLISPNFLEEFSSKDTFEKLGDLLLPHVSMQALMQADQRSYLPWDILPKVDRMSMAHGLEARSLFLDPEIVEYSRGQPDCGALPSILGESKAVLKGYLNRYLPQYDTKQPKQGFSIPVHLWFRKQLKEFAEATFFSSEANQLGLYDSAELQRIWEAHQSRRANFGFELWGVMVSLIWARRFLG